MGFYFFNFCLLFITQTICKNEKNPINLRACTLGIYVILMGFATRYSIRQIDHHSIVKSRTGYLYDANDLIFKDRSAIIQLSMACMVAAILCGITGIGGGMVLGPLFLKYNMLPTVMSSTNQYITMVASVSVAIQFAL
jgi:hypothetical protein